MQNDYSYTILGTFDTFFREMIGDLGYLDDYESEVNSKSLLYVFFLVATLILYITMLNLLIAIISDTFGEVKKAEKRTKIWEKWNIITEIDVMLSQNIKTEQKKEKYLIYIYNEKHEKEFIENEEDQQKVAHLHKMIEKNQKKDDYYFKNISNEIKTIQENQKKNEDYFKNLINDFNNIDENQKKQDEHFKNLSNEIKELKSLIVKK